MKNLKIALTAVFTIAAFSITGYSSHLKDEKTTFKVLGNCEMCKKRIEGSLKGKPGIKSAMWNIDSKVMTVTYDGAATNPYAIQKQVATSGYDTEKVKADDKVYKSLPGCCQYDR